jgi:hypothetical protein
MPTRERTRLIPSPVSVLSAIHAARTRRMAGNPHEGSEACRFRGGAIAHRTAPARSSLPQSPLRRARRGGVGPVGRRHRVPRLRRHGRMGAGRRRSAAQRGDSRKAWLAVARAIAPPPARADARAAAAETRTRAVRSACRVGSCATACAARSAERRTARRTLVVPRLRRSGAAPRVRAGVQASTSATGSSQAASTRRFGLPQVLFGRRPPLSRAALGEKREVELRFIGRSSRERASAQSAIDAPQSWLPRQSAAGVHITREAAAQRMTIWTRFPRSAGLRRDGPRQLRPRVRAAAQMMASLYAAVWEGQGPLEWRRGATVSDQWAQQHSAPHCACCLSMARPSFPTRRSD